MTVRVAALLAVAVGGAWVTSSIVASQDAGERFWPQWRGPHATGVSRHADPPLEWSETRNIRWKAEIPGRGSASPVVWGDRLFLVSAVPRGLDGPASHEPRGTLAPRDPHRFIVMAIDRATGRILWERTAAEEVPHAPSMRDGTWASSSAVTDGRFVFAFFESNGVYAYDMDGALRWQQRFGDKDMFAEVGASGATPVLHGNRLVIT
jgi:outer membrane protein assembly factor BamB